MTDRELFQMALNALEECYDVQAYPANGETIQDDAIKALRARLAQLEFEPVAWMWNVYNGAGYTSRGVDFFPTDIPFAKHTPLYTTLPQREWMEQERAVGYREGHQAALKQRVWQGLTDAEIKDILDCGRGGLVDIKKAEAKLKEKNGV